MKLFCLTLESTGDGGWWRRGWGCCWSYCGLHHYTEKKSRPQYAVNKAVCLNSSVCVTDSHVRSFTLTPGPSWLGVCV